MKNLTGLFILFLLATSLISNGQTIQVCITIDGVTMPVSKKMMLCKKDTATLALTNCAATPETNVSFKWKNLSVPPSTDSLKSSILAKDTGRWVGYIINNNTLVQYTDTIHLQHPPDINVISMTPSSGAYCPTNAVNVSITTSGPVATYQWYDKTAGPLVLIPGATNSTFTFYDKPKVIMVIAKDAYGCPDSLLSGFFSQLTAAPASLGPDPAPICVGQTINFLNNPNTLPAYANIQYGYYRDGVYISGVTSPSSVNPPGTYNSANITFPTAGQIKVWFWVKPVFLSCSNTDTVTVTVLPIPVVNPGNDTLICYGDNINLNAVITGTPPYDLSGSGLGWSSAPAGYASSTNPTNVSPTSTTTYTLNVRDANNCGVGTGDIIVNVNPQINITISSDVTLCKLPLDTATLTASISGGLPGYTYGWTPIDSLDNPTALTVMANPSTNTTYTFTATDASNCTASNSVTVSLYEPPIASILSPQTINEEVNTTLDAATTGNSGFNFQWYTNKDSTIFSTSTSVFLEYDEPDLDTAGTNYIVRVVDPGNNCINLDTIKIYATSNGTILFVPNIFSPNAESALNQRLKIFSSNINPSDFKFLIYNKWGNLVYETTNYDAMVVEVYGTYKDGIDNRVFYDSPTKGWDGGSMVEGVYTYVIVGTFRNGKDIQESDNYKGTFSLVR